MSRVGQKSISLPDKVSVSVSAGAVAVEGPKGKLEFQLPEGIGVENGDGSVTVTRENEKRQVRALHGTARSLINNMVRGVSDGFERKLELVGVGYRAQAQGKNLNLTLGFSHPVSYPVPEGITIETPSQTEIVVKGIDKQQVGQVAAEIRRYRPPEPYKGKGVRYSDERVVIKEAKKK